MSESPNDRNDRAIRIAAAWYMRRVPGMPIIVLTNDAENRRKALEMGINAMSVQVGTISHHNQFPINPYQAEPIRLWPAPPVMHHARSRDTRIFPIQPPGCIPDRHPVHLDDGI